MKKLILLLLLPMVAFAIPPYGITATFTPPITGDPPTGYNLYVDDCAVTGPVGAGTPVVSGTEIPGLITADGTYQMCVRAFNASGLNPDPGQVATVSINQGTAPGVIQNLGIVVTCRDGTGSVIPCAGSGVTVTVTVN